MRSTFRGPFLYLTVIKFTRAQIRGVVRDALLVECHGGFTYGRSSKSKGKRWLTKYSIRVYIYDRNSIRDYRLYGSLRCLETLNKWEFTRLRSWQASLETQLKENRHEPSIASELKYQLIITALWIGAFSNWFLRNRIPIPKAAPNRTVSPTRMTNAASQPIEPKVKFIYRKAPLYTAKHFKEVDKLTLTLKQKDALDQVSERYSFNREGFAKQYRTRWLNTKRRLKPQKEG